MAKPLFAELFGGFFGEDALSKIKDAKVEGCELNIDDRSLKLALSPDNYIERKMEDLQ